MVLSCVGEPLKRNVLRFRWLTPHAISFRTLSCSLSIFT